MHTYIIYIHIVYIYIHKHGVLLKCNTHTCQFTHIHICIYIHVYMSTCIYVYVCKCILKKKLDVWRAPQMQRQIPS